VVSTGARGASRNDAVGPNRSREGKNCERTEGTARVIGGKGEVERVVVPCTTKGEGARRRPNRKGGERDHEMDPRKDSRAGSKGGEGACRTGERVLKRPREGGG